MSLRLRRLQADYDRLRARCERSSYMRIHGTRGTPPERYEVEYRLKGLCVGAQGQIAQATEHLVEIVLTSAYPRQAPQCKMLTPVFHPNIDAAAICIGDHWAASEALDDLVVRIAEIITYQSYNTRSPLNGEAARWADQNQLLLPVDRVDLWPAELRVPPTPVSPCSAQVESRSKHRCVGCGAGPEQSYLQSDAQNRWICRECVSKCSACANVLVAGEALCSACLEKVGGYIQRARQLLDRRDVAGAVALLESGLREYPGESSLRDEFSRISAIHKEIDDVTRQVRDAIRDRRCFHARELVDRLATLPAQVSDLDRARQLTTIRCERATALAKRGIAEERNDPALAEVLFRRALHISADCAEAQGGLRRLGAAKTQAPELEERFLDSLRRGDAAQSHATLTELLGVVVLTGEQRLALQERILDMRNTRKTIRRVLVAGVLAALLVWLLTAGLIAIRSGA